MTEPGSTPAEAATAPLAWFKCEDWTEDDQPVGPAWIVARDDAATETELGWMTLSEARQLARKNDWRLQEDVHDYGSAPTRKSYEDRASRRDNAAP